MTRTERARAWRAVLERDPRAEGKFVYAVSSTGVFCRPTCPSRRPRPDRVAFFAGPSEALRAGFRACRRCQPGSVRPDGLSRPVADAKAWIDMVHDSRVGPAPVLAALAGRAGLSVSHFQKVFKSEVGVSPADYVATRRAESFKAQLRSGATLTRATFEAGYGSASRAYEAANKRLGMRPSEYRKGGKGLTIDFGSVGTSVGHVMVATTARGICAVIIADDARDCLRQLEKEFPAATLREITGATPFLGRIVALAEGRGGRLPAVHLAGTPFQLRVWNELQRIPKGETRTYSEIASAVGSPRAARAVGSACARNRVALAVPCHRVIRGDGATGDYRWGKERKISLLELERD